MKRLLTAALLTGAVLGTVVPALAQQRANVIWARTTNGPIVLDGVLDEPAWAAAETKRVRYGFPGGYPNGFFENGIPGSGSVESGGKLTVDSTDATFRFLAVGNTLYMGVDLKDKSIGGDAIWERFDGLLMALKEHLPGDHPGPPVEYFYSWWYDGRDDIPDPKAAGLPPNFRGRFGQDSMGNRPPESIAAWNAVTKVHGQSNSDAAADTGWTVEMKFDLTPLGYDITQPGGDIVEWNVQIYDTDYYWPLDPAKFSSNRLWLQSPWGNDMWYDEVRIYARPDVNLSSGPVPIVPPETRVRNGASYATPTIDGFLNETVWNAAPTIELRYGDDDIRRHYVGVQRWRAGEFQPTVNGGKAFVFDGGNATVKWFFKGDFLYLGFDVRDEVVQNHPLVDRWDGVITSINDRAVRWRDRNLESRRITFRVGPTGQLVAEDYLPFLRDTVFGAKAQLKLKPGTTVDTTGNDVDQGYTAEMELDLTKLGYPSGLGDRLLFIGFDLLDGDSYTPSTLSYATRTWWGREYQHQCCPISAYLDPALMLAPPTGVDDSGTTEFALLGNSPNPFSSMTAVQLRLARAAKVALEVFDLQGRRVASVPYGIQPAGNARVTFVGRGLSAGVYAYRVQIADPQSGEALSTKSGRMLVLR